MFILKLNVLELTGAFDRVGVELDGSEWPIVRCAHLAAHPPRCRPSQLTQTSLRPLFPFPREVVKTEAKVRVCESPHERRLKIDYDIFIAE